MADAIVGGENVNGEKQESAAFQSEYRGAESSVGSEVR
jgi:hypothetical protein